MPSYTPPLRDMHFVLHELLHVCDELKQLPAHQDLDQDHRLPIERKAEA